MLLAVGTGSRSCKVDKSFGSGFEAGELEGVVHDYYIAGQPAIDK